MKFNSYICGMERYSPQGGFAPPVKASMKMLAFTFCLRTVSAVGQHQNTKVLLLCV